MLKRPGDLADSGDMTAVGRHALSAAAVLLALIGLTLAARPAAAAAPIGSDGVVHACYKAKGKPKGALRVVRAGKPCKAKKGEKAIAWTVFGAPGTTGSQGGTGTGGETGTDAASKQDVLALLGLIQQQGAVIDQLSSTLDSLGLDVSSLTDQLGLLSGDVDGLQNILNGVTNGELLDVLDALPALSSVCSQLTLVTTQANALRTVISGLGLNGVLTTLGGLLQIPALPAALSPFACPA
jgi:hypothetical protein